MVAFAIMVISANRCLRDAAVEIQASHSLGATNRQILRYDPAERA